MGALCISATCQQEFLFKRGPMRDKPPQKKKKKKIDPKADAFLEVIARTIKRKKGKRPK